MKLTKEMIDELNSIGNRVEDLENQAFSNFPKSRNFVLASYTQELTSYKVNLEKMFEKTDKKEWLLLTCSKIASVD